MESTRACLEPGRELGEEGAGENSRGGVFKSLVSEQERGRAEPRETKEAADERGA